MDYINDKDIVEQFGYDTIVHQYHTTQLLKHDSIDDSSNQDIYGSNDSSPPHYTDLTNENSRSSSNFNIDENVKNKYSDFKFISQMPLEVHIKSEGYDDYIPSERSCEQLLDASTDVCLIENQYVLQTCIKRKRNAELQRNRRALWDDEKRTRVLEHARRRQRERRANYSAERRERELEIGKHRQRLRRALYTEEEHQREKELNRIRQKERRAQMNEEQRHRELEIGRQRQRDRRARVVENTQKWRKEERGGKDVEVAELK